MGLIDTLVTSVIVVIAALVGLGLFFGGSMMYSTTNNPLGGFAALLGLVFLVFAARA